MNAKKKCFLDEKTTTCGPKTVTETPLCESKKCDHGYIFIPEPICDCRLACAHITDCPSGEQWDAIKCGCVRLHY